MIKMALKRNSTTVSLRKLGNILVFQIFVSVSGLECDGYGELSEILDASRCILLMSSYHRRVKGVEHVLETDIFSNICDSCPSIRSSPDELRLINVISYGLQFKLFKYSPRCSVLLINSGKLIQSEERFEVKESPISVDLGLSIFSLYWKKTRDDDLTFQSIEAPNLLVSFSQHRYVNVSFHITLPVYLHSTRVLAFVSQSLVQTIDECSKFKVFFRLFLLQQVKRN